MDLGTTITGVVIVLIIFIPFVIMSLKSKKSEKRLLQGFFDLAEKNNCQITRQDLWDNGMIGIDDTANMIFFIGKVNGKETSKQENLAEINQCRTLNHSRDVSNKDGNYKVTDIVELVVNYHDKRKKETAMEFYNADYDGLMLKGEVQLAEKWSYIINNAISVMAKKTNFYQT